MVSQSEYKRVRIMQYRVYMFNLDINLLEHRSHFVHKLHTVIWFRNSLYLQLLVITITTTVTIIICFVIIQMFLG